MKTIQHTSSGSFIMVTLLVIILVFSGCKKDDSGDQTKLELARFDKTAEYSVLHYEYELEYSNIDAVIPGERSSYDLWFRMEKISDGGGDTRWLFIESFTSGSDLDGTLTGSQNLPSTGTYLVTPEGGKYGSQYDMVVMATGNTMTITTLIPFKIIQLQMTGDELWPTYERSWPNSDYVGKQKRYDAFEPTNTFIEIKRDITGLSNSVDAWGDPLDLSNAPNTFKWAVSSAYGTGMTGVDAKVTLLCGVDDVPLGYVPNDGTTVVTGFTIPDDPHTSPVICLVLYNSRINGMSGMDDYDKARIKAGSAIHELGHAVGITGDDPNIQPPHAGDNAADCLMHYPNPKERYTNPIFCGGRAVAGHAKFISDQTWFK